jgi:hypothetical protein
MVGRDPRRMGAITGGPRRLVRGFVRLNVGSQDAGPVRLKKRTGTKLPSAVVSGEAMCQRRAPVASDEEMTMAYVVPGSKKGHPAVLMVTNWYSGAGESVGAAKTALERGKAPLAEVEVGFAKAPETCDMGMPVAGSANHRDAVTVYPPALLAEAERRMPTDDRVQTPAVLTVKTNAPPLFLAGPTNGMTAVRFAAASEKAAAPAAPSILLLEE